MGRRARGYWLGLAFFLLLSPLRAAFGLGDTLPSPLSLSDISNYLAQHDIESVTELLSILPQEYHQNFTLVHETHSLQKASYASPRQVLFGSDAHLLFGISSVPSDPLYETVEVAELDRDRGYYVASRIHFSPGAAPTIETSPQICSKCHGLPWRPIWGKYPNWPGVYGNEVGSIADEDLPGFQQFLANLRTEPHLSHLDFDVLTSPNDGAPQVTLKNRQYALANTVMSNTIGDAVAGAAFSRIEKSPDYDRLSWLLLDRALHCSDDSVYDVGAEVVTRYGERLKIDPESLQAYAAPDPLDVADVYRLQRYRLLGIDPASQLIRTSPGEKPRTEGAWFHGVFTIYQLIEFQALDRALGGDAELRALFGSHADDLHHHVQEMTTYGTERARLVRDEDEDDWYDLDDIVTAALGDTGSPKNQSACDLILERAKDH